MSPIHHLPSSEAGCKDLSKDFVCYFYCLMLAIGFGTAVNNSGCLLGEIFKPGFVHFQIRHILTKAFWRASPGQHTQTAPSVLLCVGTMRTDPSNPPAPKLTPKIAG